MTYCIVLQEEKYIDGCGQLICEEAALMLVNQYKLICEEAALMLVNQYKLICY